MLEFARVSKSFGTKRVLNELSFEIAAGEFLVLLGPNGAGKSTTISLATGLNSPDFGEVRLFGHLAGSFAARSATAYVPQEPSFPAHVSGRQVLKFMAAHFARARDPDVLAEELRLTPFLNLSVRYLSGGQRRLLAIASAFVSGNQFVILDEPTAGLDFEARREVWKFLAEFTRDGGSLLMTTHYLIEAEELADRIVVLSGGRVVQSGSPDEIKRRFGFKRITFRADVAPPATIGAVEHDGQRKQWIIDSRSSDEALRALVAWNFASDIEVAPLNLEDVFARLIEGERA